VPYAIVLPIKNTKLSTIQLQAQQQFQILKNAEENIHITLLVGLDDSSHAMVSILQPCRHLVFLSWCINEGSHLIEDLEFAPTALLSLEISLIGLFRNISAAH
jgi:hypothetical protein